MAPRLGKAGEDGGVRPGRRSRGFCGIRRLSGEVKMKARMRGLENIWRQGSENVWVGTF